jgi:hypothetical protein
MTLLQSMINGKGCHAFLCVTEKEGKRVNYWRDRERERMSERQSISREGGSIGTKINILA